MSKRFHLESLQIGLDGSNLVISNTEEIVDGEPASMMSVDLSSPRELSDFLRLFSPVLVAAGVDLQAFIPGESND